MISSSWNLASQFRRVLIRGTTVAGLKEAILRIHYLQHVPFEGPANIAAWVERRGHIMTSTALFKDESLPSPEAFDALVVMGGPMSVHDEA